MSIKEIKIKFKWRVLWVVFCSLLLISLLIIWKEKDLETTTLTTIVIIIVMLFTGLFPLFKQSDEKSCKKYEFDKGLDQKIEELNKLLESHKTCEVVLFEEFITKGNSSNAKNEKVLIPFFTKEYPLTIEEVKVKYINLFWQMIIENKQGIFRMIKYSCKERNESESTTKVILRMYNIFYENKTNIFYEHVRIKKAINQIKKTRQFNHTLQLNLDKKINFFKERIKYIEKFLSFRVLMQSQILTSKKEAFIIAYKEWSKLVFENLLYIYFSVNGDSKYDCQVLNKYIDEFEIWKKNYYSLSQIQNNSLLYVVKDEFLRVYDLIIKKHIKYFEKIYKKSFGKLNDDWQKSSAIENKWYILVLKKEHPKVLKELFDFSEQSKYLWSLFTVELKNIIKWTNFAVKANWCMDKLEQIVKKENFNENIRQEILKNMYLFQKDRIHEFEDFLNKLLFQEDNKLEIENLTNNLITKNQKDNQTTS